MPHPYPLRPGSPRLSLCRASGVSGPTGGGDTVRGTVLRWYHVCCSPGDRSQASDVLPDQPRCALGGQTCLSHYSRVGTVPSAAAPALRPHDRPSRALDSSPDPPQAPNPGPKPLLSTQRAESLHRAQFPSLQGSRPCVPHGTSPASGVPPPPGVARLPTRVSPTVLRVASGWGAGRHVLQAPQWPFPGRPRSPVLPPSSPLLHPPFQGVLTEPSPPGLPWGSPA